MDVLRFIFQDLAHFFGTVILLGLVFNGIAQIIRAFRR